VADDDFLSRAYPGTAHQEGARGKGVSKLIHMVNEATLRAASDRTGLAPLGEIWECEQKGFGCDREEIRFSADRLTIHNRSGGRVIMGQTAATTTTSPSSPRLFVNLHLQPRLSKDSAPIALHLMFRSLRQDEEDPTRSVGTMSRELAEDIILNGFLDNFIKEGFDEDDVEEARKELRARFSRLQSVVLLPACEVPDAVQIAATDELFRRQLFELYKVESLEDARKVYNSAFS